MTNRLNSHLTRLFAHPFRMSIYHKETFEYSQHSFKKSQLLCFFMKYETFQGNKHVEFLILIKEKWSPKKKKHCKSVRSTRNPQNEILSPANPKYTRSIFHLNWNTSNPYLTRSPELTGYSIYTENLRGKNREANIFYALNGQMHNLDASLSKILVLLTLDAIAFFKGR